MDRLQAEPVLVRRPDFDRLDAGGLFRHRVGELFLNVTLLWRRRLRVLPARRLDRPADRLPRLSAALRRNFLKPELVSHPAGPPYGGSSQRPQLQRRKSAEGCAPLWRRRSRAGPIPILQFHDARVILHMHHGPPPAIHGTPH
jgi:hypothetical protein